MGTCKFNTDPAMANGPVSPATTVATVKMMNCLRGIAVGAALAERIRLVKHIPT